MHRNLLRKLRIDCSSTDTLSVYAELLVNSTGYVLNMAGWSMTLPLLHLQ